MLKDSETPRYASPRVHRTYSPVFKAQLVAACQQPSASIAALALAHGMNANVLHRWIKEHARSGCHQIAPLDITPASSPPPAFLAVQLPAPAAQPAAPPVIRLELRKGALAMEITWPVAAAADCAAWVLKRIEISAASSKSKDKKIKKRLVEINPIEDAESVVTRLKDCIASPELCLFCIQIIEGNLQHLQRVNRWVESVRRYFQHRLSGLRRRLPEETLAAFEHLLQVVSFPERMPPARIQPPIWFSKKSAPGRKAKPKKDAPKITLSK